MTPGQDEFGPPVPFPMIWNTPGSSDPASQMPVPDAQEGVMKIPLLSTLMSTVQSGSPLGNGPPHGLPEVLFRTNKAGNVWPTSTSAGNRGPAEPDTAAKAGAAPTNSRNAENKPSSPVKTTGTPALRPYACTHFNDSPRRNVRWRLYRNSRRVDTLDYDYGDLCFAPWRPA